VKQGIFIVNYCAASNSIFVMPGDYYLNVVISGVNLILLDNINSFYPIHPPERYNLFWYKTSSSFINCPAKNCIA